MKKNAEEGGAQWAVKNDARVTRVGKYLRKFRLDELPQIFNVLQGEMSFIGPRPERPEFNSQLEKVIPFYNLRHTVRPGITGWAQVLYDYGNTVEDSRQKLQFDLYYIKNSSVILDVQIILRTLRRVIFGAGL
jgi:lipopolysaccharide/colanic/teichoic acid biosynthesis glycosyltransferase